MSTDKRAYDVFFFLFLAVALLSVLVRFWNLDVKPLHHDEGVNGFFLDNLIEQRGYRYDPQNYHGPIIYYLAAPAVKSFGRSIFALRFVPALLGALMVVLFWLLKERLGKFPAVCAAAMVAASPTLVYYSREFIHEIYLVFFTLAFLLSAEDFARTRRPRMLLLSGLWLALGFTTKETTLLHSAMMLLAFALAMGLSPDRAPARARDLLLRLMYAPARAIMSIIKDQPVAFAASLVLFWVVIVTFFSSFFTNLRGIADFFAAFTTWTRTGLEMSGHSKPAFYFLRVLWEIEPLTLLLGALGVATSLRSQDVLERFASFWALLTFIVYSAVPYKTPWLVMDIMLPLVICAACFVRRVLKALKGHRVVAAVCVAAFVGAVGWSGALAWDVSLVRYDDNEIPIVYVQTFREMNDLVSRIDRIAKRVAGDRTCIYVFAKGQWPLSWYLHRFDSRFPETITARKVLRADIIVASLDQEEEIEELSKGRFVAERFNLRPQVSLTVFAPRRYAALLQPPHSEGEIFLPLDTKVPLETGLVARYFKGPQLLPPAYRVEVQNVVDFEYEKDFGKDFDAPASMRWDGYLRVPKTGQYGFLITSDDGSRFFVDGVLLIDNWGEHAAATRAGKATLAAGYHRIRVDYFDAGWGAVMKLEWDPPDRDAELLTPMFLYHAAAAFVEDDYPIQAQQ
ncbi:MAG TPA: flippase activity-associated protein Agl23 [bacterium]|nr:flippase activity-associated protein Agl23 [bacterium]